MASVRIMLQHGRGRPRQCFRQHSNRAACGEQPATGPAAAPMHPSAQRTACRLVGAACRRHQRPWAAAAGPPAAALGRPPCQGPLRRPATRAGGGRCRVCCCWAYCCCWALCCCWGCRWPLPQHRRRAAAGRAAPPPPPPPVGPSRPPAPGARLSERASLSAALLDARPWRRRAGAAAERGCDTQRPAR